MKEEVLQIKTMGEKINNLFKDAYKRHLILVNRKYQRKLVWTIEEKKSFYWYFVTWVSSAIISFAKTGNGKEREIIDGLQRLDAIFLLLNRNFQ